MPEAQYIFHINCNQKNYKINIFIAGLHLNLTTSKMSALCLYLLNNLIQFKFLQIIVDIYFIIIKS